MFHRTDILWVIPVDNVKRAASRGSDLTIRPFDLDWVDGLSWARAQLLCAYQSLTFDMNSEV